MGSTNDRLCHMSEQARAAKATRPPVPLLISLFRVQNAARRSLAEAIAKEGWPQEAGLRPGCFGVLRSVAASTEPLSQRDLSDRLGIDPSDIVGLVDVLEGAGLVTRRRDEADRRRYALELTDAGWVAVDRFDDLASGVSDQLLANLSAAEQAELERLLERVLADRS